uniref:DUF834 domain-containing protein n=1 Tax=Oryza glumipatula TaxID=40148 RepID=A0A0D9Z936_9ORYZ
MPPSPSPSDQEAARRTWWVGRRGSGRRGGVGGWGGGGDNREEEEEGRGCGGHGRHGWRRLAAYQPHYQHLLHRADSSPTSCAAASSWPRDAAITSPSDREAAKEVGEEEAWVGGVAGEMAGRSRKAAWPARWSGSGSGAWSSSHGELLFLLGLRHDELGVAIGGRPKGY